MKKISALFLLPLLMGSLLSTTSCSKSGKIKLTFGEVVHQSYRDIYYRDLNQMIDNKESFLLVVDPQGCSCFNEFMRASETYLKDNHYVLYRILMKEFDGNNNYGIKLITGNTTFAIFNAGELSQCITSNETKIMRDESEFKSYMDNRVSAPNMYFVNEDYLKLAYHSNDKSVILFERLSCGDCTYIIKNFLIDYMKEKTDFIYVFDGDIVRGSGQTPEEQLNWTTFKNYYGLSNVNNPDYGYGSGYVPTMFLINGTATETNYISGCVIFNDTLTKDPTTGKVKVTETYYSPDRLNKLAYAGNLQPIEGLEVNSLEYTYYQEYDYYAWDHTAAMKYHQPYLKAFLDYALPKTTLNLLELAK